ncbi:MAG: Excisionase/Xis, DNA-binding, partial [uncultured Nocardioides sp.]
ARSPVPDAGRRRGDPRHVERTGLRAGAPRRPACDQDRRSRPVAGRAVPARGLHPADVRRDARVRRPAPVRGRGHLDRRRL